jgi:hypothetical protein
VHLDLDWEDAPQGALLQVHSTQSVMARAAMAEVGSLQLWLDVLPQGDHLWVEVYTADGALCAFTNPVFIDEN